MTTYAAICAKEMKIMSQGKDREEAEIAAIEAVLMHIGVSAALTKGKPDGSK